MKGLLVGDVHLSDRPPSIRTDSYAEDVLRKLWHTVEVARDFNVDFVAWAGDVFHLKAPSRTSHALVQRTAEVGKAYGVPWLIVPGNHDMSHDRLESLAWQPLGVLSHAGAFILVDRHPELPVFGVPWLQDWKRDLPRALRRWRENPTSLIVTHAPIFPTGQTAPYEIIASGDWARMMGAKGDVYYGHIHDPTGEFYEPPGSPDAPFVRFCNQGALSRGSLHEATLLRKPAVTVWSDEGFRRVEVPHRPPEEVFRLVEHGKDVDRAVGLGEFLQKIGATRLERVSVEAVAKEVESMDLAPPTRRMVLECLEEALSR